MLPAHKLTVMCGRYTLIKLSDLMAYFPWIGLPAIMPDARYNIAPSQSVAVVTNESEQLTLDFMRWGLVPIWAKDGSVAAGSRMINARAETLSKKPAFSRLVARQRCVIPADGFYEWKKSAVAKIKTPYRFHLKGDRPFMFAGLWDGWKSPDGQPLRTCTIITTAANAVVSPIHDRMPAMLKDAECRRWITPGALPPEDLMTMLIPYPPSEMAADPVSAVVNNANNEGAELIRKAEPVQPKPFQPSLFPT